MFLLILYNFLTCFDLITYCSLALFMTNFTFNSTCVVDGSVNVHLCMNVCMYVYMYICTTVICGENTEVWMLNVVISIVMTEF
jgi:hypothetical protein